MTRHRDDICGTVLLSTTTTLMSVPPPLSIATSTHPPCVSGMGRAARSTCPCTDKHQRQHHRRCRRSRRPPPPPPPTPPPRAAEPKRTQHRAPHTTEPDGSRARGQPSQRAAEPEGRQARGPPSAEPDCAEPESRERRARGGSARAALGATVAAARAVTSRDNGGKVDRSQESPAQVSLNPTAEM